MSTDMARKAAVDQIIGGKCNGLEHKAVTDSEFGEAIQHFVRQCDQLMQFVRYDRRPGTQPLRNEEATRRYCQSHLSLLRGSNEVLIAATLWAVFWMNFLQTARVHENDRLNTTREANTHDTIGEQMSLPYAATTSRSAMWNVVE